MAYTDIDDPSAYFQTLLWSGNGSNRSLTFDGNSDLQPDWSWIKQRSGTNYHTLTDSVRGLNKQIYSNATDAEATQTTNITAYGSNGVSLGTDSNVNGNSSTYVGWFWKAGTSFTNDASSTGIGSIDSAGSFNNDNGFSIVSYTGTGSAGTIKHGLSTTPSTIIYKRRNSTSGWVVWHTSLGTGILELNETGASQGGSSYTNGTAPTSSVFSIGTSGDINADGGTFIAYCFAEKQGYSKFGSYTGNGNADGTFVYTGFKPAWIMVKITSGTSNWRIFDNKRIGYNVDNNPLYPNVTNTEGTEDNIDILSNGFKWRTTDGALNGSGSSYIYMAFAENPFVTSTGVPATAR